MNILETDWWTMTLPPEWWADKEDDSILVGDRDEVGCLELSTLRKEHGQFESKELRHIAESEAEAKVDWQTVTVGDFAGISGGFLLEGVAIREWYVASQATMLFISYSCDEENAGMDDAAVDEILDTLLSIQRDEN